MWQARCILGPEWPRPATGDDCAKQWRDGSASAHDQSRSARPRRQQQRRRRGSTRTCVIDERVVVDACRVAGQGPDRDVLEDILAAVPPSAAVVQVNAPGAVRAITRWRGVARPCSVPRPRGPPVIVQPIRGDAGVRLHCERWQRQRWVDSLCSLPERDVGLHTQRVHGPAIPHHAVDVLCSEAVVPENQLCAHRKGRLSQSKIMAAENVSEACGGGRVSAPAGSTMQELCASDASSHVDVVSLDNVVSVPGHPRPGHLHGGSPPLLRVVVEGGYGECF